MDPISTCSRPRLLPSRDLAGGSGRKRVGMVIVATVGALTLNAEAELLLLVGDVAGDSANQGHGQGTGHTSDGTSLGRHSWAKERDAWLPSSLWPPSQCKRARPLHRGH